MNVKQYCEVCDCLVVVEGHVERCRPKVVRGWTDRRAAAWIGDTVHRMDVQLALRFMQVSPTLWEYRAQEYTNNGAMAAYVRGLGMVEHLSSSCHTDATLFEASYFEDFRVDYLKLTFPNVCSSILSSWVPPILGGLQVE